jgi:hypothetical protein
MRQLIKTAKKKESEKPKGVKVSFCSPLLYKLNHQTKYTMAHHKIMGFLLTN